MVDHIPQPVYNRAKDFGWRTHLPLLDRNMPYLINECPKSDGGKLPANVHNWVSEVYDDLATFRIAATYQQPRRAV